MLTDGVCFSLEPKDYKEKKHWRLFFKEKTVGKTFSVSQLDSSCFMFVNYLSIQDYFSVLTLD